MKVLAWILGCIALVGSIVVCANWFHARKEAKIAARDAQKFAGLAADIDFGDQLERQADEMRVSNDEKRIENDDIEVQIAELKGRGIQNAYTTRALDRYKLESDRLLVQMTSDQEALGGNPHSMNAKDRQQAAMASLQIYAAMMSRDVQLAYALGVIWLAFGFAVAMAGKSWIHR